MKILVAMSGGVDSSVVAALLARQADTAGYQAALGELGIAHWQRLVDREGGLQAWDTSGAILAIQSGKMRACPAAATPPAPTGAGQSPGDLDAVVLGPGDPHGELGLGERGGEEVVQLGRTHGDHGRAP